ncbi:uncharacterized protein LOC131857593 [Cryptomeria japonica]|uniref:uncharacterized protein LOC131857593 n=1 Tax=Cryptomeria japonica TaxID=3369 RepID=UPI0027DA1DCC|nr:uncharacterized protein LOC131857593 [Cryptomeria japonica]
MNSRGALELREFPKEVICSARGENFVEEIKDVHEQVKTTLQKSADKYKEQADKRRKEVHFQVGDMVWVHLKKERLPKGRHTKLMMRKIRPCMILKAFGSNAYKVKLPHDIGLSPIFNVSDLTLCKNDVVASTVTGETTVEGDEWLKDLSSKPPLKLEKILDTKVVKRNRNQVYKQYLVKWNCLPKVDATWLYEHDILKFRCRLEDLFSRGLENSSPGEYGAGAPSGHNESNP